MAEFLTRTTKLPPYLMFPRFLLNMKLPETSKILYIVLLDRARLSQQNEGWIDEYGHVFLYFPITNLAQELGKSEMTIKTSLATLEKADLIFRKRMGTGNPNRIYVKIPFNEELMERNLSVRETENCPCDGKKTISVTDRKPSTNKNYKTNNYLKRNTTFTYECKEDESL